MKEQKANEQVDVKDVYGKILYFNSSDSALFVSKHFDQAMSPEKGEISAPVIPLFQSSTVRYF